MDLQRELNATRELVDILSQELQDTRCQNIGLQHQVAMIESRARLLSVIAKCVNEAATIGDALQNSLDAICTNNNWYCGHFYIQLNSDHSFIGSQIWKKESQYKQQALDGRDELVSAQIWHGDDNGGFTDLKDRIEIIALTPGFGFVGKVISTGKAHCATGDDCHDIILPAELAQQMKVRARYAFPIMHGGRIHGVMEFFVREAKLPDDDFLETMADIGLQLGHVIARKYHEEKLGLLQDVIMSSKDSILITRADTLDEPGPEILFVNDAFLALSGYSREEVIGQTPRMLQGPNTDRGTLDRMRACLEDGQPFNGEIVNYAKDGREYWLDISIVPLRATRGRVTHFAAIERDITLRKENEASLQEQIRKAEAASKAKSDFLANMSHELRTPMNGVLGMAGLLKDTRLDNEQSSLVDTICHSGETLLLLLNDILDFSKIEAGELSLEEIPFNVSQVMQGTIRLMEPLAKKKGLILTYHTGTGIPDFVVSDPTRIRQVIINLIGNAIKFTEKGFVKVDIASARLPDGRAELHVKVDDTGIGIKAHNLDKIFQKFTQADESTTRRFGGTGLGLTICKLLIEKMGGAIGVTSTEGRGSSFWFTLPVPIVSGDQAEQLREEVRHKVVVPHDKDIDYSRNRVLVIDDHPVNLVFARKLLAKIGVGVVDAIDNGAEGLRMIERGRYDMVITDCQMPDMDGYEVCRHIRAHEPVKGGRLPVIAMTANAMVGDREKCLEAGMDDYISKPISENRMIDIMLQWLRPHPQEPAAPSTAPVTAPAAGRMTASATPPASVSSTPNPKDQAMTYASDAAPVDMDHINAYFGDDEAERNELITMFLDVSRGSIDELKSLLDDEQKTLWKKTTHKLKGSAANFGAPLLSAVCKKAEESYELPRPDKEALLAHIQQSLDDVRRFLDR